MCQYCKPTSNMTIERLRSYSLNDVEGFYNNGLISYELFEQYKYEWRNGAFRFSNELIEYQR